jgi:predicted DNA-binding transcriptional regulator AlpA
MSEDAILERFDRLEKLIAKLVGERVTRTQMLHRLGISGNTLTTRIRAKQVPSPGADGKWLLSEVVEWESREAARNV